MSHEQLSFRVARALVRRAVVPLLMDLRVTGLGRVPAEGPFIAVANHLSMLDIPLLMAILPRRPSIMGKKEMLEKPLLRRFFRWGDGIPVRRGGVDRAALRAAEDRLSRGIPFGIFPEGTRIRTGRLETGKLGAGMIALRSRVPVVPVAFTGTQNILRGNRPHLRPRVEMAIGAPISPEEIAAAGSAEAATELMMRRIAELLPPERRGPYGDAPEGAPPPPREVPTA